MVNYLVVIALAVGTWLTGWYISEVGNATKQEQIAYCEAYGASHDVTECSFIRQ